MWERWNSYVDAPFWEYPSYNHYAYGSVGEWMFETAAGIATAAVYLPASDPAQVKEGGQPAAKAAGVKFLRTESGAVAYEVGSGRYQFSVMGGQ